MPTAAAASDTLMTSSCLGRIEAPLRINSLAQRNSSKKHGMEVSSDKNKTERSDIRKGFTFLGIDLVNGAIRPSRGSRTRLLSNVSEAFEDGIFALRGYRKTGTIDSAHSLLRTLYEVRGILSGWGHHYSFCNEINVFAHLDQAVDEKLREYLGLYAEVTRLNRRSRRSVLGFPYRN
jgi:RNA-directed DNA polymerase